MKVRARKKAEDRRRQIVDATIVALCKHGAGAVSVRLIASEADVSPSLLNHHFDTVDNVISAAATQLGRSFLSALDRDLLQATLDPHERLAAHVRSSFAAPAADPAALRAWFAILGLTHSMPCVDASVRHVKASVVERARCLLAQAHPSRDHQLDAIALTAFVQGLWIEVASEPADITFQDAADMAYAWTLARTSSSSPSK